MEISRKFAIACAWGICAALAALSLSPFYLQDGNSLSQAGGIGALLLVPIGVLFRSSKFAHYIRSAPYGKVPIWAKAISTGMLIYAACAVIFFTALWASSSEVSDYGNLVLAPFSAFAFYMGRWALFRA